MNYIRAFFPGFILQGVSRDEEEKKRIKLALG
jgi:hypothetical protein